MRSLGNTFELDVFMYISARRGNTPLAQRGPHLALFSFMNNLADRLADMDVLHRNVKEEKGPKKIPKYNQIYTNIYKIYKIYTKYQSAARRRPASSHLVYILYILYIFGYIVFFCFGVTTMPKKYQNIVKYIQIYTNIYKIFSYILVYICV